MSRGLVGGSVFVLCVLVLMQLGSRSIGLTWDESTYLTHAGQMLQWIQGHGGGAPEVNTYLNPHPPLLKWFGAAAIALLGKWIGVIPAFRLGHHFVVALLALWMLRVLKGRLGWAACLGALGCAILQPRVYGQMCLGTSDGVVAIAFLGAAIVCAEILSGGGLGREARILLWMSILVGMLTKITGLLLVAPLVCVALTLRRFRLAAEVALVLGVGLVLLVMIQPQAWGNPLGAIMDYVLYPLARKQVIISTFYRWTNYGYVLPWHYPIVMSASIVPEWLLLGFPLCGLAFRSHRWLALSFAGYILLWMLLLATPQVPRHDEVRQFLAVFPLLGAMVFLGGRAGYMLLVERMRMSPRFERGARVLGHALLLVLLATPLASSMPWPTMYYNELFGGVSGAESDGNEMTLYFEPLDRISLQAINATVPTDGVVQMRPSWPRLLLIHQMLGSLRNDIWIVMDSAIDIRANAECILLFRRRSLVPDAEFLLPAKPIVQRDYKGVEVMRLVKADSGFRARERKLWGYGRGVNAKTLKRWNGVAFEERQDSRP